MDTKEFVYLLTYILCAMPPEGDFCKILKKLADTDAASDMKSLSLHEGGLYEDVEKLVQDLDGKFGSKLDFQEVVSEWGKQASKTSS